MASRMDELFSECDTDIVTMKVRDSFESSGSSNPDNMKDVLGINDDVIIDIEPSETQLEDEEVSFHDNEHEFHFRRKIHEILTIIMCCLFLFSTSYSRSTPKDMQTHIDSRVYPSKGEKAAEAFVGAIGYIEAPSIIIAPFAGYLVWKCNTKLALILFMTLSFLGSLSCSTSVLFRTWFLFPLGRIIYGLGVGCLRIAVNMVIKESVGNEKLGLYMQFPRTAEKLASLFDGYFTSWSVIADKYKRSNWIALPFIVGTGIIAISLPFFILFLFEPKNKNQQNKKNEKTASNQNDGSGETKTKQIELDNDANDRSAAKEQDISIKIMDYMLGESSPLIFVWSKMKTFPLSYWMIIIIWFFIDAATGCYQTCIPQFVNIYGIKKNPTSFWHKAANIRQIPLYFAILSPIFGQFVDWSKNKRYLLLCGGSIGLVIHHSINILFAFAAYNKWNVVSYGFVIYPNLLFQGFCNAFIGGTLIPGIAFTVHREALSVAYGCQASIAAVAGLLLPMFISFLIGKHDIALKESGNAFGQIADDDIVPTTKYTVMMAGVFLVCSILGMLLIFMYVLFWRKDICPPEQVLEPSAKTIKIVQDMEEKGVDKDEVGPIRSIKKNLSEVRRQSILSTSRQSRMQRRRTSVHYISRFG